MKIILSMFLSFSLFASVTLVNKDATTYKLFIEDKAQSAIHTSIGGNTTTVACSKDCKIVLKKNRASIEAKDGDTIVIKNGALSKQ